MIPERPSLERRVLATLDGTPAAGPRIPVVLGGCGTGRTSLLLRLRDLIGRSQAQYIDVERIATTPERFLKAIRAASPFPGPTYEHAASGEATRATRSMRRSRFSTPRARPASRPRRFCSTNSSSCARSRASRAAKRPARPRVGARVQRQPVRADEPLRGAGAPAAARRTVAVRDHPRGAAVAGRVRATLPGVHADEAWRDARVEEDASASGTSSRASCRHFRTDGRSTPGRSPKPRRRSPRAAPPIPSARWPRCSRPAPSSPQTCRFCYELRLHRARGYGALKAILEVLSEEEPLTLTEIALRLHRTPGSTKDYLSWLEDVDLIVSRQKRYSFADPMLRLWVRLHCRPVPPSEDDIARELQPYVLARLPHAEPALALAGTRAGGPREELGDHRDRLDRLSSARLRDPASPVAWIRGRRSRLDVRAVQRSPTRPARRLAPLPSCSGPSACATGSPSTSTSTRIACRDAGPISAARRYAGRPRPCDCSHSCSADFQSSVNAAVGAGTARLLDQRRELPLDEARVPARCRRRDRPPRSTPRSRRR